MEKGIAFAGNMIVDQVKYIQSYPAPQTLTTIHRTARAMGGLVCNCIATLAKFAPAVPLKAVGILGQDEMGDYILEQLGAHPSINTARVLRTGEVGTSFTDVMTTLDGARTFFTYRGADVLLGPEHFDFARLDADILHIGYILLMDKLDGPDADYPSAMCRVLAAARAAGIQTSIDVVSEDSDRFARLVPPALPYTDYCIVNEIEAGRTTGMDLCPGGKPDEALFRPCAEKLAEMGVGRWVVIHTPVLSCGLEAQTGNFFSEPSWRIPAGFKKSSVGAGDAFAAGVLYSAHQGHSLAQALHIAGAVAAYSLSGHGASDAIKPLEALMAEMETYQ